MTGDWSWLVPAVVGIAAGLVFYGIDLARASARLHLQQVEEINRLRATQREIDPRLEILNQQMRKHFVTDQDRELMDLGLLQRTTETSLSVFFGINSSLANCGGAILVQCDRPVFHAVILWRRPDGKEMFCEPEASTEPTEVLVDIPGGFREPGTVLELELMVDSTAKLTKALILTPPAGPPPTTDA